MSPAIGPLVPASPDRLHRSVFVVVDPRDVVSGERVTGALRVRLEGQSAQPVRGRSGVHCFVDLRLAPGSQVAVVEMLGDHRARYHDGREPFNLVAVPQPNQPLLRNPVIVSLLPRPAYAFDGGTTLVRGRLVRTSDRAPLGGAMVSLLRDGLAAELRGRTDERGEFVVAFPSKTPEEQAPSSPVVRKFKLRFLASSGASFTTAEDGVEEGTTRSLQEIKFPGV